MMLKLTDRSWREFNFNEIFTSIQRGKRLKTADHVSGLMPYVSSSAMDNGVDNFVANTEKVRIFEDCLTIANSGSVGNAFYQNYKFVASDHVTKLENKKFTKYIYLFLAPIVSRLTHKYSFNREINDSRIQREKILLPITPQKKPDWKFMEEYIKERYFLLSKQCIEHMKLQLPTYKKISSLNEKNWGEFLVSDIFTIKSGKRLTKNDMTAGNRPFIGASDSSNGITNFVNNTNVSLDKNVLGVNYNGSVVENFFHPYECIFSDDVKRFSLKAEYANQYIYLFFKSIILQQKIKYAYGYKFNEQRMKKQILLVPVDDKDSPDWEYMEQFSKNIIHEKITKYLNFYDVQS